MKKKIQYDATRFFWKIILRFSPTCDLQWEISRRHGVESVQLEPYEERSFPVFGPATVTINRD